MFKQLYLQQPRTGEQPKCPLTDEWIKKQCHLQQQWMDLDIVTLSQVSQRKTNIIWYYIYVESKYGTHELVYKIETDSQT